MLVKYSGITLNITIFKSEININLQYKFEN